MTRRRASHAIAALVLALAACRSVLELDDRKRIDEVCGGVAFEDEPCGVCVTGACCDVLEACTGDAACMTALACLAACPSDGADECRRVCRDAYATGFGEPLAAVLACQADHCSNACGLACGGYVYPSDDCAACNTACCDEATRCGADSECLTLAFCARGCAGAPTPNVCVEQCKLDHLAGGALAADFSACLAETCPAACGDQSWWCLDQPTELPPLETPHTIEYLPLDYLSLELILDATVKVCAANDTDCSSPFAVDTSASGSAKLEMPAGFNGYFEISAPGYATMLFFPRMDFNVVLGVAWTLFPEEWMAETLGAVEAIDPGRGHIVAEAFDCTPGFQGAAGVRYAAPGSATVAYARDGLLATGVAETDGSGLGAIVNLPPGPQTISAEVVEVDRPLDERSVIVRAGAITSIMFRAVR